MKDDAAIRAFVTLTGPPPPKPLIDSTSFVCLGGLLITGLDVADFQVQGLHAIRGGFPCWVGVNDESDILAGPRKDKYMGCVLKFGC